jgi:hypothetical protein
MIQQASERDSTLRCRHVRRTMDNYCFGQVLCRSLRTEGSSLQAVLHKKCLVLAESLLSLLWLQGLGSPTRGGASRLCTAPPFLRQLPASVSVPINPSQDPQLYLRLVSVCSWSSPLPGEGPDGHFPRKLAGFCPVPVPPAVNPSRQKVHGGHRF